MGTGGRNVKDGEAVGVGSNLAAIIENAKLNFAKNKPIVLEILVATDRFTNISVPTTLCKALGISSDTELETQIKALGVENTVKRYSPALKAGAVATTDAGRASLSDIDSFSLRSNMIGTRYIIKLHTPIPYKVGQTDRKRAWYSLRVPQVVSIPAFALFLARFATKGKMPLGFKTERESRLYIPKDSTKGLTTVDKVKEKD